jgi:hypothetical protein
VAELESSIAETEALTEEYTTFLDSHFADVSEADAESEKTASELERVGAYLGSSVGQWTPACTPHLRHSFTKTTTPDDVESTVW